MKCTNCGYELKKPHLKTCPLCGQKVDPMATVTEEEDLAIPGQTVREPEPAGDSIALVVDTPAHVEKEAVIITNVEAEEPSENRSEDLDAAVCQHEVDMARRVDVRTKSEQMQPVYTNPVYTAPAHEYRPPVSHQPQPEITPEDPDQYMENGSYQPYPEDIDNQGNVDSTEVNQSGSTGFTLMVIAVAAIAGLLLGVILYLTIG